MIYFQITLMTIIRFGSSVWIKRESSKSFPVVTLFFLSLWNACMNSPHSEKKKPTTYSHAYLPRLKKKLGGFFNKWVAHLFWNSSRTANPIIPPCLSATARGHDRATVKNVSSSLWFFRIQLDPVALFTTSSLACPHSRLCLRRLKREYLACSNTEWLWGRTPPPLRAERLAKLHPGQGAVSVCHHHYCTIHILTDPWSHGDGRIVAFRPRQVMRSALPTRRLFTPDRPPRSLWAVSADGGSPGWNVMQAAGPGWGRGEDKETDGPAGLKSPGVREQSEGGTQIRVDIIFWAKGENTDSYCCKSAKPS